MNPQHSKTNVELPTLAELFLEMPLDMAIDLSNLDPTQVESHLERLKQSCDPIELYCVECEQQRTFRGFPFAKAISREDGKPVDDTIFPLRLLCILDPKHQNTIILRYADRTLVKISQAPLIEELHPGETVRATG